jgi:hypothetical protein
MSSLDGPSTQVHNEYLLHGVCETRNVLIDRQGADRYARDPQLMIAVAQIDCLLAIFNAIQDLTEEVRQLGGGRSSVDPAPSQRLGRDRSTTRRATVRPY